MFCGHCGDDHPDTQPRCPRTMGIVGDGGPCGTQIDRYKIEKLLGGGAFGSVYRAYHARTQAVVAFKVLRPELMTNATILERFLREATTAASVGSEHVVRVVDAEVTAGNVAFIAMEYVPGEDLRSLLEREGPLHPARAVGLVMQLLQGLAAAHDRGVVHRDVKPANALVMRRRDVHNREQELLKVMDFGISKVAGAAPLTAVGATIGTPNYMAWEQFTDSRAVDARTDLYAAAAILHECIVGKKPFEADDIPSLMNKVRIRDRKRVRDLVPSLPVPLCAVIEKGLEKHQADRWQSARQFIAALEQVVPLLPEAPPLAPSQARTEIEQTAIRLPTTPKPDVPTRERDEQKHIDTRISAPKPGDETEKG
ncbi:MAG: serine/threonine-protein kinase [Myxococcaceae bacterium]